MSPARPVPIVLRAPAAGLFGRKSGVHSWDLPGKRFPWEQLLFAGDSGDAVSVVVPFPFAKS